MSKTKVVRGAGGRFESVPDTDVPVTGLDEEIQLRGARNDSTGPIGGETQLGLIPQILENCERVRLTALQLSNTFHYTGLKPDNGLYNNLFHDEREDQDGEQDAAEYSAGHMVSSILEIERDTDDEPLLSTAGNLLGYRVIPVLSIALFALVEMTGNDRTLAFEPLFNIRATDNTQRYENIVELRNRISNEVDSVVSAVFGLDDGPDDYTNLVTQKDQALIQVLRIANEALSDVMSAFDRLGNRINDELV